MIDRSFWAEQRVLLTGHTGFKGSWASLWLESLGTEVAGYALAPDQSPSLFDRLAPFQNASSTIADLADHASLRRLAESFRPTLLLHMAAQPLVRRSYSDPSATFATNVQGTVNVLEAVRDIAGLKAALVVTTDKVYRNNENGQPFGESDPLGGHDPYSASKAAAELVVATYRDSFFVKRGIALATARAGNVIGGGDWSEDRLVPDVWRALRDRVPITLRYPHATRPWQHVLESISGYFLYLQQLAGGEPSLPSALNFGPADATDSFSVADVVDLLHDDLTSASGWLQAEGEFPIEMTSLALDSSLAIRTLGWKPRLTTLQALEWTADWYRRYDGGEDPRALSLGQLDTYEAQR